MRCSSVLLRNKKLYPCPGLIYPQPYDLFSRRLRDACFPPNTSQDLSGIDLFNSVSTYTHHTSKAIWNSLSTQEKQVFFEPSQRAVDNHRRLATGFSIATKSENDLNPYYDSGLYPWEIIKDKLRRPPPFASDIYDILIQEAFGFRKSVVKPELLYQSELELTTTEPALKEYKDLSPERQAAYEDIFRRKMMFFNLRRQYFLSRKVPNNAYNEFYKKHEKELAIKDLAERNRVMSELWKKSKPTPSNFLNFRGVLFKERTLEIKVAIVMDYIFESGSVVGFTGDWRDWKREVLGSDHYLDRIVFPYIVDRTAKEPLVKELPLYHGIVWDELRNQQRKNGSISSSQ